MDWDAFSKDLLKQVQNDPRLKSGSSYEGPYDVFMGFLHAISWKADQNWLLGLLGFHCFAYFITIYMRKWTHVQIGLLFLFGVLVYLSELINAYCAINWRRFSSQNYFDEHGVFTGLFWAAPLLILMMFQMNRYVTNSMLTSHCFDPFLYRILIVSYIKTQLNALYQSSSMLVEVKVAELKERQKKKKKKEN